MTLSVKVALDCNTINELISHIVFYPITRRQILDTSKLKEFAEYNFKFDENGRNGKKTLWVEEKLLVASNFSFSHSVFKRLV